MTIRYCGPGGSDAADGLSWATRKLTLNGVENTPVAAGDTVYVGPGVYREMLTLDVSGTAGSPITYVGDVTGEHTDGIGGIVRITGSDNDTTAARTNCITGTSQNYRTFRGIACDTTSALLITNTSGTNLTVEDCFFAGQASGADAIYSTGINLIVRRCVLVGGRSNLVSLNVAVATDLASIIENCLAIGSNGILLSNKAYNVAVRHCTAITCQYRAVQVANVSASGTVNVNNCLFYGCSIALYAGAVGDITENYNDFYCNNTDRTNVNIGANSVAYPPLLNPALLLDGFRFPWTFGELSKWSQLARIAGASGTTDDFYGIARPATESKKSWGSIQATGAIRDTATTDGGTGASIKLPDAGQLFVMRVPTTSVSTTISLKVYREANYDATGSFLPEMILRQPGQSDITVVDTGAVASWNTLTTTFTPAASPPYVDIFAASGNVATTGSYGTYIDTVSVS